MTRFTLNPHERALASICTILCVKWHFPDERATLLALLAEVLPKCRRQVPILDLVVAAQDFIAAKTVVEWSAASLNAGRAIPAVIWPDVVVREPMGAR